MISKYLDNYLSNICGFKCFIINSKKKIKIFLKIKSKFLLVLKTNEKINLSDFKGYKVTVKSKLIQFKKKIQIEKKPKFYCRAVKYKDKNKLLKICRENLYSSRFENDKNLSKTFLRSYRAIWIKNFFLKKRGDYLFVAYDKKKIYGFILLIKEQRNLRIDQILVGNNFKRLGVAKTLINFTSNQFFGKFKFIVAGTYNHNLVAKKMYKSLDFVKQKKITNVFHLYPK
tara:strand:- start:208 stop:891 length:684 start_codon:yes stop_codon:yes gene_type:complete